MYQFLFFTCLTDQLLHYAPRISNVNILKFLLESPELFKHFYLIAGIA